MIKKNRTNQDIYLPIRAGFRRQSEPPVAVHKAHVGWWHEAERKVLPSQPWTASTHSAGLKMKPQTSTLGLFLQKIPHVFHFCALTLNILKA